MKLQMSSNYNFLNNYFTTKEFSFIDNVNLENEKIDNIIEKQSNYRDIIVNYINNLNNLISSENNSLSSSEKLQLLSDVQTIFEKINENIKMLQELKSNSSNISDKIVDFLIQIESNPEDIQNYLNDIQNIKNLINDYYIKNNNMKSEILLNDIKIDSFFEEHIVKNSLISYEINSAPVKAVSTPQVTNDSFDETNIEENHVLLISEKSNKVFLPFTKSELNMYLEQYPDEYISYDDVIKKEFILPLDYYMKHPILARFRETYSLIKDRESKSILDSFRYAFDIMFHHELNPAIIAACKTQEQLENYLSCIEKNKLDDFTDFIIKFEINPL